MRLENVKVGETYMLKIGRNAVAVTVKDVDAKGKISVATAAGKVVTVSDAGRLAVHHTNVPGAQGARGGGKASKATKAASGRNVREKGAPRLARPSPEHSRRGEGGGQKGAKARKPGLVDAAIQVMKAAGKPMNCQEVVKVILEKKLWETTGKTPAATLYSSILREIQKKGSEARFVKTERGKFALKG
jgi:hypothetical protein